MGAKISVPHGTISRKRHSQSKKKEQYVDTSSNSNIEDTRSSSTSLDPSLLCFNVHHQSSSDRMTSNHFALKALFEGNVLPIIQENIDFGLNSTRVLDIGCGPGSWVMDMATEYPNTQFVGIDKLSLFPQDIRPANVQFQLADILSGLPFEDETFHFIQMRLFLVTFNRTQWTDALKEVGRLLKPGGFIQLIEPQLMDEGDNFIKEYSSKLKTIMEFNDFDSEVCDHLSSLLEKTGFTPKINLRKPVPLENHPLSEEFMYIVETSVDACKQFLMEIHGLQTNEEFTDMRKKYMQSRRKTDSVFTLAIGQK